MEAGTGSKKGERVPEGGDAAKNQTGKVRHRSVFLLVFLVFLGVICGVYYYARSQARVVTDDAYVHATLYNISPRIAGTVVEVLVDTNQNVEAGQLLVRLDPEEPELRVRLARAAQETARMRYEEALIGVKAAREEEKLVAAKLAQAKKDLKRAENLWKKKTFSQDQYDRAVTRYKVLSAQQGLTLAQSTLAEARIETSRTAVENSRVQLDNAKLMLSYTEIRTPGQGVVSQKMVEKGMVVQPGVSLLAVVDLDDVWVEANYKEIQLKRIHPGINAEVEVDTYPGRTFKGHVESLEAGSGAAFSLFPPENATGNWVKVVQRIPVKVILDDYVPGESGIRLRMGMSTEVTILPKDKPFLSRVLSFLPGI